MNEIRLLLEQCLDDRLLHGTLSKSRGKDGPIRARIRPVLHRGERKFQLALQVGKQEFHENLSAGEAVERLGGLMETEFMQMQLFLADRTVNVLVSKKGKVTVKEKKETKEALPKPAQDLSHNRKKQYILEEGKPVPFLVDLGVMTKEGKVIHAKYDKFRQINRFLEFIRDIQDELPRGREAVILDFGCVKSYLTFAMYYYLKVLLGLDIRIIGLDLKEEVIRHCNELAREYSYDKLSFLTGNIADYTGRDSVDMVVTLHACDTATDFALEKAVRWNAKVILSVPCCQHELNSQISCEMLSPVLKYGLIRERMAALFTDAIRAGLLEEAGYQVQILEFIDMEHTPKNILIRAVKDNKGKTNEELGHCMEFLGVHPTLKELLDAKRGGK
ncbi:MAG TPA: SAM-dependent methyltransferase [Candidatus Limivivens merdigallinarum]|uniref:SAM-dependent methyltransferase n=1 Tax=Candidatus Limivivens merdigallinarum TaxID=2840859 RepID=A0A9D0ZU24_9FIRM|nr:SAM-dependent methyltransferase [Candidatus Limivivens merdigallinarum]